MYCLQRCPTARLAQRGEKTLAYALQHVRSEVEPAEAGEDESVDGGHGEQDDDDVNEAERGGWEGEAAQLQVHANTLH